MSKTSVIHKPLYKVSHHPCFLVRLTGMPATSKADSTCRWSNIKKKKLVVLLNSAFTGQERKLSRQSTKVLFSTELNREEPLATNMLPWNPGPGVTGFVGGGTQAITGTAVSIAEPSAMWIVLRCFFSLLTFWPSFIEHCRDFWFHFVWKRSRDYRDATEWT